MLRHLFILFFLQVVVLKAYLSLPTLGEDNIVEVEHSTASTASTASPASTAQETNSKPKRLLLSASKKTLLRSNALKVDENNVTQGGGRYLPLKMSKAKVKTRFSSRSPQSRRRRGHPRAQMETPEPKKRERRVHLLRPMDDLIVADRKSTVLGICRKPGCNHTKDCAKSKKCYH